MPNEPETSVYKYNFIVPPSALDENGHVNNVMYVQWMQDIAVEHYELLGGVEPTQALNCTWVVREHKIEYLLPAFAGEEIEMQTWVADVRRVRSLRKYRFVRVSDGQTLVRGETDWVLVDVESGLPHRIPPEIVKVLGLEP
jgi:acyl-CoA thioester hydrolase